MLPHKAIRVASFVAARTGLLTSLDRWNRHRGGIIVAFHDVSRQTLTTHLNHIAERYEFVSLTAMARRIAQRRSTTGLAAITFDDGLKDVIEAAAEIAHQRGWPMTFFLPTAALDRQQPFWFQEIDALLLTAIGRTLVLGDTRYHLHNKQAVKRVSDIVDLQFKNHKTEEESIRLLDSIRVSLFGTPARPDGIRISEPISWSRVRELAQRSELSFESHSITHRATSRLDAPALKQELVDSKSRIEEMTGRPVEHFCYPYGGERDIGTEAPELVRKLFRTGTTMARGRCSPANDLALLPRVPLYEGDAEEVVAMKIGTAR